MIRLSRSLLSSMNELVGNNVLRKDKSVFLLSTFCSRHGFASTRSSFETNGSCGKIFTSYTIYKGKAALCVTPKLPTLSKLDSGSSKVDKMGVVFLTFSPAVGLRKYDWTKKQTFALNPTEVGSLIGLGPAESCDFLHDPSMKSSFEGQVKKSLSVTPINKDGGYFLNLTVTNLVQKTNERFSVPVTTGEFTVMRTALSFALPHIMGWAMGLHLPIAGSYPSNKQHQSTDLQRDPSLEWER